MDSQYSKRKTIFAVGGIIAIAFIILGLFFHFNSWTVIPASLDANLQIAESQYADATSVADAELSINGFTETFYNEASYAADIAAEQAALEVAHDNIIAENKSRNIFETNAAWFFTIAIIVLVTTFWLGFKVA